MGLEAPCTLTNASGDRLYVVSKRSEGDIEAGRGGEGRVEFMGGTGKYAGVTGDCPYETDYVADNQAITMMECAWDRP